MFYLVFGGSNQGQVTVGQRILARSKNAPSISPESLSFGAALVACASQQKQVLWANFSAALHSLYSEGGAYQEQLEEFLTCFRGQSERDCLIVMDDVSCGLVPLDAAARAWREISGQLLQYLAQQADCVVRTCAGLAICLKGESLLLDCDQADPSNA